MSWRNWRRRRNCANCRTSDWVDYRWCRDCWRAGFKGAAAAVASALVTWVIHAMAR